ncbi:MAG: efflux RND transporter periplasmic adaptor subunit [Phycisphaerae bacterium]|nr:efflux RND transporter periplasmic adaptor subunit [Phycisphaerae bacterium]
MTTPPPSPKPRRGPRVWPWLLALLLGAAAFVVGALRGQAPVERARACLASRTAGHAHEEPKPETKQYYTCGMHPWVVLPKPGLCPICHMDLTPLDPAKFTGEIAIDPVVTQNIGVRIAPVTAGPVSRTLRTVGTVAYDETALRDVTTKVGGWIESIKVDSIGRAVAGGEPLLELYSPEIVAAQEEYLIALRSPGNTALIDAARTRLEYLDMTPDQLRDLAETGVARKTLAVRSPFAGIVVERSAYAGARTEPGTPLYRLADLSRVWVMVSLYEYQLPFVRPDQPATMSLPYFPGREFEGRVAFVYPYLDPKTRQASARLEFENAEGLLKPGMFAGVRLSSTTEGVRTLAPREAVLDTGARTVAFVSLGEGRFEPRTVRTGMATDDGRVEVLEGLAPGEMVVTSGQFLLDSEARIREGLAKMIRGEMASEQKPLIASAGASKLSSLPPAAAEALSRVLDDLLDIGNTLAADTTAGVKERAASLASTLRALVAVPIPEDPHFWHEHPQGGRGREAAERLAGADDIESARKAYAALSAELTPLVGATGVPPGYPSRVQRLHCPMYDGGVLWLQREGRVRNPYYGAMMLECFDERAEIPTTGAAPAAEPVEPAPAAARDVGAEDQKLLDAVYASYLAMQQTLIKDDLDGSKAMLGRFADAAKALAKGESEAGALGGALVKAASIDGATLDSFREGFEPVSDLLIAAAATMPPSAAVAPAVRHAYCPMVDAAWLQAADKVENPYDPGMLRCGVIRATIPARQEAPR